MSININGFNIGEIYAKGFPIKEVYKGNILVFQKSSRYPITIEDYEYTLDSNGDLVLTKYIGNSSQKDTPNLGIEVDDYEYTFDSDENLVLTKYIGTLPNKINPNL